MNLNHDHSSKKVFFGSNLYKIDVMITSLIEIPDLHNFESRDKKADGKTPFFFCFFFLSFLSRTCTNHGTAGEGGGRFFDSSLPLPPA